MIGAACVRSRCRSVALSTERSPPRAPPACRCVRADVSGPCRAGVADATGAHSTARPVKGRRKERHCGRRAPDRPVRQDAAARGRPSDRCGGPRGDRSVRGARTRARARPHLPRHPAGAVERARRRARRRAGRRRARPVLPLRRPAAAARRRRRHHGPLRPPAADPVAGPRPGARRAGSGGARGDAAAARRSPRCSARASTTTPSSCTPSERGHLKQALLKIGWPAEDLAGLRRRRGAPDRAARRGLAAARLPAAGRRRVLGRRLGRGRAAVRRGQDAGRRGRDGEGEGDHADPGHQHRRGPAVEARADRADHRSPRTRSASTPGNARRSGRSRSPPIR